MATAHAATGWPSQPVVLEINTWVWLNDLARARGAAVTLGAVQASEWDDVLLPGVDAVWLMGVWTRSPAGSVIARTEGGVREMLHDALPDLSDDDVVGSPYCIRSYTVDNRLGGSEELAVAREVLAQRGIRLLLDYVPNHVARDHSWISEHPEHLVHGTAEDLERAPGEFIKIGDDRVVALGRDPYFPPWSDVVQLNAFAPQLRAATAETLAGIAEVADGVRCDMAMLLLNEVFARTWGERAGAVPEREFWPDIIAGIRDRNPGFLFMAEAYWDLEDQLLDQGFDYCYDKRLYDRLVASDAEGLRTHLAVPVARQRHLVRFIENHDEPRAAVTLPGPRSRAAAVAVSTLPGALLLYEGQAEARTVRPPVQLARRPDEPPDHELQRFYSALLAWLAGSGLRDGRWELLPVEPTGPDSSAEGLVAWSWDGNGQRHVVVVNLWHRQCEGRVRLPWGDLAGHRLVFSEVLGETRYPHDGDEVADLGLYVQLDGGGFHVLNVGV